MTGFVAALFCQAVSLDRSSEKVYFRYALYLDQLMRDAKERQTTASARSSSSTTQRVDHLRGRSRCWGAASSLVLND